MKVTGDYTKDRETLQQLVWDKRSSAAFGWNSLSEYIDVVLTSLLEMYDAPHTDNNAHGFWAFVRDMAPEKEE